MKEDLNQIARLLTEQLGKRVTCRIRGDDFDLLHGLEIWALKKEGGLQVFIEVEGYEVEGDPVISVLLTLDAEQKEPLVVREAVDFKDWTKAAHHILDLIRGPRP